MAHQDYISRSSNKKSNPYKKKGQPEPQGTPLKVKIIAMFTLIAVMGFAYSLWFLKDVKPTEHAAPVKAQTKAKQTTLPEPPKEKWQYIEKLQGDKEIEGGEYEVVNKGPYKMQCGSFRTMKQAETLKANIAFAGLIAQVSKSTGKNGIYYKVFLGPYDKKREAEKDKHKLKRNNINRCQIWLWR
ncbi:SPOR domain-containing protein [Thalassotalea atypica]|uniref:SPOR domain-containing protein n=1 Tax=Thalassotalea atypica TaxID=2054316 RepID=UPI002572B3C2|nr:SPOR domain-containing protein [Thalassotalea atypica]